MRTTEGNGLYGIDVVAKEPSHLASLVMAVVHLALEVSTDEQWALVMLPEDVDLCIVEELALVALDYLKALVLSRGP